jgi:type VI secretion system secreted protein VgrG
VDDLLAATSDTRTYRLRVVPRLFALTLVELHEIFIDTSVPGIVEAKLSAMELMEDTELRLSGSYPVREFVVQYGETDLAFLSRLTEHAGISYLVKPGDAAGKVIFTDHAAGFPWIDEGAPIAFSPKGAHRDVYELSVKRRVVPAYYATRDYNYRAPHVDLVGEYELAEGLAGGIIEFGCHTKTPEEGKALARIRAEERLASQLVYSGESNLPNLFAGARFKLHDHPDLPSLELLITEIMHDATQVVSAGGDEKTPSYRNTFQAIPADRPFRPERITPRPRISGLITGVVDSPAGAGAKYAPIDDQGRYLVRFYFDAGSQGQRAPSRPVRMLQNHVGANYGTHFPLRPGVEVAVGFVNGDPDRPMIVGAVPNPHKPSPVTSATPGVHRIQTASGIVVDMFEDV